MEVQPAAADGGCVGVSQVDSAVVPDAAPIADRVLAEVTGLAATQRRMEMVLEVIQQEVQNIAVQVAPAPAPMAAVLREPLLVTHSFRSCETSSAPASLPRWEVLDRGEENVLLPADPGLQAFARPGDTMASMASTAASPASVQIRQGLHTRSDDSPRRTRSSIRTGEPSLVKAEIPDDSGRRCVDRCVLNPNSAFHFGYSLLLLSVLFHDLTFIPVILAWDVTVEGWLLKAAWLSCIFWTVDLVLNFVTGFYRKGRLVIACRQVVLRYLQSSFVPYFLMVICDWLSLATLRSPNEASLSVRMLRLMKIGKLLRIAGVFRVAKVAAVLMDLMERNPSETVRLSLKCGTLVVGTLLMNHLIGCTWFAIGRLAQSDTGMRWVDHSRVQDGVELDFLSTDGVYQWVTAMHWSMAQITLGSIEFSCYNSVERSFTIVSMAIGVVFSSTLVSSLSASMVDYQLIAKDKREKMSRLWRFLRENRVAHKIAHLVLQQANERVNTPDDLREEDVHVLPLLPKTLRAQLRFELFQHHLKSNPLFNLWSCFDLPTVQWICMEAVGVVDVTPQDDLFTEGTLTSMAYYLKKGCMVYSLDSTAPHADATENTGVTAVNEASWMSEASLWVHWTHVGTAKATTKCEVLSIFADDLMRVLRRSRILFDMAQKYCQLYHQCVNNAKACDDVWLSDLLVPHTSLPDMMLAMDFGTQVAVSLQAIEYVNLTQWIPGLSTGIKRRLHAELSRGECCIFMNSNQAERLVGQVLLRLTNEQNKILVEFHGAQKDGQKPTFWLPGVKPIPGELRESSAARLLEHMCIPESDVEYITMKREEEVKNLPGYGMPTRFVRHTHHMSLKLDLTLPTVVKRSGVSNPVKSTYSGSSGRSGGTRSMRSWVERVVGTPSTRSMRSWVERVVGTPSPQLEDIGSPMDLSKDLETTVYLGREQSCFYMWFSPEQFKYLHSSTGQQDWAAWVERLDGINVTKEDDDDLSIITSQLPSGETS